MKYPPYIVCQSIHIYLYSSICLYVYLSVYSSTPTNVKQETMLLIMLYGDLTFVCLYVSLYVMLTSAITATISCGCDICMCYAVKPKIS